MQKWADGILQKSGILGCKSLGILGFRSWAEGVLGCRSRAEGCWGADGMRHLRCKCDPRIVQLLELRPTVWSLCLAPPPHPQWAWPGTPVGSAQEGLDSEGNPLTSCLRQPLRRLFRTGQLEDEKPPSGLLPWGAPPPPGAGLAVWQCALVHAGAGPASTKVHVLTELLPVTISHAGDTEQASRSPQSPTGPRGHHTCSLPCPWQ